MPIKKILLQVAYQIYSVSVVKQKAFSAESTLAGNKQISRSERKLYSLQIWRIKRSFFLEYQWASLNKFFVSRKYLNILSRAEGRNADPSSKPRYAPSQNTISDWPRSSDITSSHWNCERSRCTNWIGFASKPSLLDRNACPIFL